MQENEIAKLRSESFEKDGVISQLRTEGTKKQHELNRMLNTTNEEKDKMRSEYLTVIER